MSAYREPGDSVPEAAADAKPPKEPWEDLPEYSSGKAITCPECGSEHYHLVDEACRGGDNRLYACLARKPCTLPFLHFHRSCTVCRYEWTLQTPAQTKFLKDARKKEVKVIDYPPSISAAQGRLCPP